VRAHLTALAGLALLATAPAGAAVPLPLAERQVVTLEFTRPVARLATTDPSLLGLKAAGARLEVTALRGGRAQLDVTFDDGAAVSYDVTVEAARRGPVAAVAAPGEIVLAVGQVRRLAAPGLASLLVEESGVVRVRAEGEAAVVTGVSPGTSSVVLVDGAGRRTTVPLRVVP
jgi:hypothetical protein